jgi:RNA polymerase sigma-70 factor, ECF subfamily
MAGGGGVATIAAIPPVDDPTLLAAAQAGERGAMDRLLRQHYDRVYALCRRIAGNDADAADAAQEALIAIVKGLPRFDGRSSLSTWIYRVTTNACLDELRRRGRRPQPALPDHETAPMVRGGGVTEHDSRVTNRITVDGALAQIPEEFRMPVMLRDLCDLDYAEIAEQLNIPPGTVRSRISRGRAALAKLLVPEPGNPQPPGDRPTEEP